MGERTVLTVADVGVRTLRTLLERFGLLLTLVADAEPIPASYWGDREAGIAGRRLYVRRDTPLHSALHETCHMVCMNAERRECLDGDAGSDELEEAAVCYLQVLLADCIDGVGSPRLMRDMDAWGYSFRLGSTERWFAEDAADARAWLQDEGLLDAAGNPGFRCRA